MARVRLQGELDLLCGVYAIVNAFELCGIRNSERVFECACSELPRDAITRGTNLAHLKKMLAACKRVRGTSSIAWCFPFEDHPARDDGHFWRAFGMMMDATATICAIVGMNRPRNHWTVVKKEGGRLSFYDSIDDEHRKNASRVASGKRHADPNIWLLDRTDVVLFQRWRKPKVHRGPPW